MKNRWILKQKITKFVKKSVPKTMFFSIAFFYEFWEGLGRILGGFWEGFGSSWRLLGHFLGSIFEACIQNALQKGSWRLLGSIWASFWRVWEGFGKDFGTVLGEFWGNLEDQKFNFSDRVLEDNTGVCQGEAKGVCYGKVCLVNAFCLQRQRSTIK